MKKLKWIVSLALILTITAAGMFIANGAGSVYRNGDKIDDFTVTACDGRTYTLSEILEEKDLVVLNFWATWCGYCEMEFPYMEEAYQQYRDDIEIIAITCEPTDTDQVIADFAAGLGLTFPMATDAAGLSDMFGVNSFPTTVVIDRNGIMCFSQAGMIDSTEKFASLFGFFASESYSDPVLLNSIPGAKPNVARPDEAALADALGNGNAGIRFYCNDFEYSWPMTVAELDGRNVVESANAAVINSTSYLYADFEANAGDAAVVTFRTAAYPALDMMRISLDGQHIKTFSGSHDWTSYAVPITESGAHTLCISFENTTASDMYENMIWIDGVEILSGEAAAAAIAENPVYPVSDVTRLVPINEGAREIMLDEPSGSLNAAYDFYIVGDTTAEVLVKLAAEYDPESTLILTNFDSSSCFPPEHMTEDGYLITAQIDSLESTGYSCTALYLASLPLTGSLDAHSFYFADEDNLNAFLLEVTGGAYGWYYADEEADNAAPEKTVSVEGDASYTLIAVDQDGNPVPGAMIQVCDDSLCMVYTTGEDGTVTFELPAYEYEVHLLIAPEGYTGDTETISYAPAAGGEITFVLTKN